jgi:hypothetical protein
MFSSQPSQQSSSKSSSLIKNCNYALVISVFAFFTVILIGYVLMKSMTMKDEAAMELKKVFSADLEQLYARLDELEISEAKAKELYSSHLTEIQSYKFKLIELQSELSQKSEKLESTQARIAQLEKRQSQIEQSQAKFGQLDIRGPNNNNSPDVRFQNPFANFDGKLFNMSPAGGPPPDMHTMNIKLDILHARFDDLVMRSRGLDQVTARLDDLERNKLKDVKFLPDFELPREVTTSEQDLEVHRLQEGDTMNGIFTWTDEPLSSCDSCDQVTAKMNKKTVHSVQHHKYITENRGSRHIYVSLSTSPSRLPKLHNVLKSLNLIHVNAVFVCIPKLYRDKHSYKISKALLRQFPQVQILVLSSDIGPAAKILTSMHYIRQTRGVAGFKDDIIISVDDDRGYPVTMIPTLAYYALKYPKVTFAGSCQETSFWGLSVALFPHYRRSLIPEQGYWSHVLEGFAGIAYHSYDIDIQLAKQILSADFFCRQSDDLVISTILAFYSKESFCLPWVSNDPSVYGSANVESPQAADFDYFQDEFALHNWNN